MHVYMYERLADLRLCLVLVHKAGFLERRAQSIFIILTRIYNIDPLTPTLYSRTEVHKGIPFLLPLLKTDTCSSLLVRS